MRWSTSTVRASAGFIEPCLPTKADRAPIGPQWAYEIKHDGYRLMVRKVDDRVKIYTRRGADWTKRFPRIVEAVRRLRVRSVLLDGEGVIVNRKGMAVFDRLHSCMHDDDVFLYTFDLLELDGEDWRKAAMEARKARLAKVLARVKDGIQFNEHIEDDGQLVYEHACKMGLEGIVAKRLDLPYQSGRAKCWIKVKNPKSPAALRVEDGTF